MTRKQAMMALLLLPYASEAHAQIPRPKAGEVNMWIGNDKDGVMSLHLQTDTRSVKVAINDILDALDPE